MSISLSAQEKQSANLEANEELDFIYDEDYLSPTFHKERRKALRNMLPDSSAAIFFAAPERNRANDVYYEYHQDPNFYYLSGLTEPNAALIIFKEKQWIAGDSINELLFIQNRNPFLEVWNGRRYGVDRAQKHLGIDKVLANSEFQSISWPIVNLQSSYIQMPFHPEDLDTSNTSNLTGLVYQTEKAFNSVYAPQKELDLIIASLRQDKQEEELRLLQKAIDITCQAQIDLMKGISPEMKEYQTEAIVEYRFKKEGAEYTGFPSIQGSGENACILHYTSNRRPFINGGLLISDVGAEYHGYTADVSRTIPPDGKFNEEEAAIYSLVLKAQDAGIAAALHGNPFTAPHEAAKKVLIEGLKELGIIKDAKEIRKYFMHGTSHYLGLDVHDAGRYGPLLEGQVITVEPGIYIAEGSDCDPKWWNIGVRIEDDILIQKSGPINMSAAAPRSIEAIEALMIEAGN